jgi:transcriptional regulator with XRE-family HTH domain
MLTINNLSNLGKAIRDERKALGMTQLELASLANIRRETVIKAESGKNIDTLTLLAIVGALGKGLSIVTPERPAYEQLRELFDED